MMNLRILLMLWKEKENNGGKGMKYNRHVKAYYQYKIRVEDNA